MVRQIKTYLLLAAALLAVSGAQTASPRKPRPKVAAPDERAGTIIARAEDALAKKDYASAEPLLKEAVQDDPDDYRAWYDLGFLYGATGRTADAVQAYKKSIAANPKLFESTYSLGVLLAKAQDPKAQVYLRAATQLTPGDHPAAGRADAWRLLGRVIEGSDPAGALAAYAESAKLQPRDLEPHLSAGVLLERLGRLEEAEKEYASAADLDPKSSEAIVALANLYQKEKRWPEAAGALRKYLALEPGNAAAHFQLGRLLAAEQKPLEAIPAYENGLKLKPADADARRELAALYSSAGKFGQAEPLLRSLLAADSGDAEAHATLGSVLLRSGKPAEAQSELLAAIKLSPRLGGAYDDLALAASENKNFELAIRALDARVKLGQPENAGTYFLRATAYDSLHDRKQAAENYRLFLEEANGRFPDQEWKARHRLLALEPKK